MFGTSTYRGSILASVVGTSLLVGLGLACNGGDSAGSNGAASNDGGSTSSGGSSTGEGGGIPSGDAGACDTDPLKTGLPPLFNGLSVDAYDCAIVTFTAKYGEPDAMIFK